MNPHAASAKRSQFVPPLLPDRGAPGRRKSTASRGVVTTDCNRSALPLIALAPEVVVAQPQAGSQLLGPASIVGGLTTSPRPTFWFYVPANFNTLEFVLQDGTGTTIYQADVPLTGQPGIIPVVLPKTAPELQSSQSYQWYFLASCHQGTPQFVQGWIQRISPDRTLMTHLTGATLPQQAVIYANSGIWYDALTLTLQRYQANPDDPEVAQQWQQLLRDADLEDLYAMPLQFEVTQPAPERE